MADGVTPNYSFNLPLVGGDDNAWGGLLNDNWSSIDTLLWNVSGVANAALTQSAGDARYLQLTGGTLGPNSLIVNGPSQFANYVQFTGSSRFDCSIQANFTGGATFGTAQVFFNSQVTFSADALMVTPGASDNSNRAATTAWVNGAIAALPAPPAPSTTPPAMDGTAAPGTSALFSRGDHVHPSDTSRLPLIGGTLTGPLTLAADPAAALQAATKQYVDAGDLGGGPGGFVNKLRNGTFDVWQRGTSVSIPLNSSPYTADGWLGVSLGSAGAAVRGGGQGGAFQSLELNGATGNTQSGVQQRIESYIAAPLAGATCTFQAWIFNGASGAITPQLEVYTVNAQDDWPGGSTNVLTANLQTCPSGGVWTRVAYTFTMPAGASNGAAVQINFGPVTTGGVAITAADLRATPGVATGLNANPPPPELRPIAIELAFCKRYFIAYASVQLGVNITQYWAGTLFFPVAMRASPTIINPSYPTGGGTFGGAADTYSCTMSNTGGAWSTVAGSTAVKFSGSFSAEL